MKNNPLAFPSHGTMGEVIQSGMTLRDWFAGIALQALIPICKIASAAEISIQAYEYADKMLQERERWL